jgi:hypothetical protein
MRQFYGHIVNRMNRNAQIRNQGSAIVRHGEPSERSLVSNTSPSRCGVMPPSGLPGVVLLYNQNNQKFRKNLPPPIFVTVACILHDFCRKKIQIQRKQFNYSHI